MGVGALLGFPETVLAFDLDMVETMLESESYHLGALRGAGTIGYQREACAELLQTVESVVRAGKTPQLGVMQRIEPISDLIG